MDEQKFINQVLEFDNGGENVSNWEKCIQLSKEAEGCTEEDVLKLIQKFFEGYARACEEAIKPRKVPNPATAQTRDWVQSHYEDLREFIFWLDQIEMVVEHTCKGEFWKRMLDAFNDQIRSSKNIEATEIAASDCLSFFYMYDDPWKADRKGLAKAYTQFQIHLRKHTKSLRRLSVWLEQQTAELGS